MIDAPTVGSASVVFIYLRARVENFQVQLSAVDRQPFVVERICRREIIRKNE